MNNQNKEYPYGEFPFRFTKGGQQQLIEKLSQSQEPEPEPPTYTNPQPQSNLDITKMLPLLNLMGDKKNISQTDMLQFLIPILTGGSVPNELLSMLSSSKSTHETYEEQDIEEDTKKIDEYVKIN